MGIISRLLNWDDVYGEPFLDKKGLWRIRIFQEKGRATDFLFSSSIEDTYPTREAAAAVLKSVKRMEIRNG